HSALPWTDPGCQTAPPGALISIVRPCVTSQLLSPHPESAIAGAAARAVRRSHRRSEEAARSSADEVRMLAVTSICRAANERLETTRVAQRNRDIDVAISLLPGGSSGALFRMPAA